MNKITKTEYGIDIVLAVVLGMLTGAIISILRMAYSLDFICSSFVT